FFGEPGIAAVPLLSGGLAAAGCLLCLVTPLGWEGRLAGGLAAAFFTAAVIMAFVMGVAAPVGPNSPDDLPDLGVLLFLSLRFSLGLLEAVYQSYKKITAKANRAFRNLIKGMWLVASVWFLLLLYPDRPFGMGWGELVRSRMVAGIVCAIAFAASFLFFLAAR